MIDLNPTPQVTPVALWQTRHWLSRAEKTWRGHNMCSASFHLFPPLCGGEVLAGGVLITDFVPSLRSS